MWGRPPKRYYQFLRFVEGSTDLQKLRVAILGCSDGKFVLPAARRGHHVLGIDVDEIALFGGTKLGPHGGTHMPGLLARLQAENLEKSADVVHADFVEYQPTVQYHAVFTSGSVQYQRNLKHPVHSIVVAIQSFVAPGGFLYVDYMLPSEPEQLDRANYLSKEAWKCFFPEPTWTVLYNRVLPPLLDRAHVDFPIDHFHTWGHLLVRRNRDTPRRQGKSNNQRHAAGLVPLNSVGKRFRG
jgi:SAM-dependent methyltransferase